MYTTQSKMISRAIWVEKKHVWKINLQKNGVRKSFYSSVPGDKGRKICAQNATSWLSGACPFSVSERTTVDTVFERYLQDKALETTNIYTIRNRYNNHIKPIIGKVPVMLLTKQDLKRVIYTAYRKHNLSQKSLKNIRGDLSGFCNYLDCADIRNDLRTSNIKIPSNAKKGQKQALDVSSLNILFTESQVPYNGTICQDSLIYAYRFQVVTGLRPGELMGLEWGDIDNDYIHIRRAINAKGITTNGKNEFAARDFPQTRYTRMLLESQQVYRVTPLDPHERVFGSTGQLCYRKRWGIYCRYNGIPYITPYELRHTFSSMTIFNDDADNLNFLHILDFCADENFIIMAYCLMGNHLHLLAKDCNDSLQHMMKAIGVRYVAYYNRRYQRTGPLFQGRYKSQPVTTKGYFLRVLRYIHRNPVAAGMVQDMQDYPWSSYIDYFASRKKPLCHVDTSYALALHDLDWLRHYHQQPELNARGILEDSPLPAFTDAELCDFVRATAGMECHEIQLYPESTATPLLRRLVTQEGVSITQLSRLTGMARGDIRRRLL